MDNHGKIPVHRDEGRSDGSEKERSFSTEVELGRGEHHADSQSCEKQRYHHLQNIPEVSETVQRAYKKELHRLSGNITHQENNHQSDEQGDQNNKSCPVNFKHTLGFSHDIPSRSQLHPGIPVPAYRAPVSLH